jgi:hypothetical protein
MVDLHGLLDGSALSLIGLSEIIVNFPDAGTLAIT